MKLILLLSIFSYSLSLFACPKLQGRYGNCYSEIKKFDGEFVIDQHQENNYEVYNVDFNNSNTGEHRTEVIKTDNKRELRSEKVPSIGLSVKIDVHSHCEGDAVISDADVYFLGAKVGSFVSKFIIDGKLLKSNVDGAYLNTPFHKRIVCELE